MPTGAMAYVNYGYEDTFKTASTKGGHVFGVGQKLNREESNNIIKIFGLGARYATNLAATAYSGKASIDFVLSNPWFFRGVFGGAAPTAVGTQAPFAYYWVDTAAVGGTTKNVANTVPTMSIANAIDFSTTNTNPESTLLGAVVDAFTLTCASNDTVKCKVDTQFADVGFNRIAYSDASGVLDTFDPFIYSQGQVYTVSGTVYTAIGKVQNCEMTCKNNAQQIVALGARGAQAYVARNLEIDLKTTILFDTDNLLEYLWGTTSTFSTIPSAPIDVALAFQFDNSLTGSSARTMEFKFGNAQIDASVLNQAVEEAIMQEVTFATAKPTLVKATNSTTTDPTA